MPESELRELWSGAPWTLRLYVASGCLLALLNAVLRPRPFYLVGVALFLVIAYLLLRGVRWLWFVTIAGTAIYVVGFLLALALVTALANLLALLLLLAGPTRRFFARPRLGSVA